MTRYLLDTNHLSPLVTLGHSLRQRIQMHMAQGDTFFIPAPVLSEFLFGIGNLPRAAQNLKEWQTIRNDFSFVDITTGLAEEAATLRLKLQRTGWQLELFDALIAVVALHEDLVLLTTDKDFSTIKQLRQENWRAP